MAPAAHICCCLSGSAIILFFGKQHPLSRGNLLPGLYLQLVSPSQAEPKHRPPDLKALTCLHSLYTSV